MVIAYHDMLQAIQRATFGRSRRPDVAAWLSRSVENAQRLINSISRGTYMQASRYRRMLKKNANGKVRNIYRPELDTLILQHLCMIMLEPYYAERDPGISYNCKPGWGLTAKARGKSLLHRAKHIFYDRRDLHYLVHIDQRKCYDHIKPKHLRRALKRMGVSACVNDFACDICFHAGTLPIGAPTSPLVHHLIMLEFDLWLGGLTGNALRYADDLFLFLQTKDDANQAIWRVRNYWWYEYGIRAKRHTAKLVDIDVNPVDLCGYILHRHPYGARSKGHVSVRRNIMQRARRANNRNWGSYFGILKHADTFGAMKSIERKMKLRQLTNKIRIDRRLDADPISVKDLAESGDLFTIYDYELRCDAKGRPNWIKCLIGIEERNADSAEPMIRAYEFHGCYAGIVDYLNICEKAFGKANVLPLEDCMLENRCGYVFKDSTNIIKYIT
mgnify:CR=1 FL=1